ncbi:hypothetical protein GLOIN_2v1881393 [Rhizophagus irregularis DAOM 181602=DAOM 197198]|nr:hypothetical protein GLOIN_2v1881393 [Rhizophagus irregularis DAOM 181602=DAOM 197198]
MESAYKFTEYRYRFLKETKNIFSANSKTPAKSQERVPRDGGLSKTEQSFLELIRNNAVRKKETIQEIVLKCTATSFDVYIDEIKRLSWENSKLREELRRKISQEVEKTRSELKKVKIGVNKEFDQLKKSKKGRSTSNRRKREEILEIPVLPENVSNDQQAKEARDIFFYDIPNIGVKTTKNFIRWYDAKLGLKGRQERDQWQTVRDLTNEEMESIKRENTYDFTKKLQQTSKTAFIKIIKITKNWKVIGYFRNLKEMEEAVEDSCTQGDINRVWLVRNKKTIYKDGDAKTRAMKVQEKIVQEKVIATENRENRMRSPLRLASEPKTPITPPERIYRELGNFASRKESLLHPSKVEEKPLRISKTPDENEVVEMIKKWRVGEENTPDHNDTSENKGQQLKKDNVVPEEAVDIIKDYRTTNKIKYVQYQESTHNGSLIDKLMEVKDVFNQLSNAMEWERINTEALHLVSKENKIDSMEKAKDWAMERNNFFHLGQRIINEKKIGEKRPILESPSKWSEIEDVEERSKAFTEMYKEKRQREQLISFSPSAIYGIEEDTEEEEIEEKEVEPEASPSKKKSGKKKKKKNNKK